MVVLPSSNSSIILLPINIEMITVVRTITVSALTRSGFGLILIALFVVKNVLQYCMSLLYSSARDDVLPLTKSSSASTALVIHI